MNTIQDLELIETKAYCNNEGVLVPYEYSDNFNATIKRTFIVFGEKDSKRGKHAHKKCVQYLCCISGNCLINCDDSKDSSEILLDNPKKILKIPNEIWSSQDYLSDKSILMVFCTHKYLESDYIRDYNRFIEFRSH